MTILIPLIAAQMLALAPQSRLWIDGDSNLHPWTCQAIGPEARIEIDGATAQIARALTLRVRVDALECGNGKMNEKLREALKSEEWPVIEYRLVQAERLGDGPRLKAIGELTVAGQTRTVSFLVDVTLKSDGTAGARGNVEINMSDFGVEPPSAMLGLLKTYDRITVSFEIQTVPRRDVHASAH